jgi:hypothetical protein
MPAKKPIWEARHKVIKLRRFFKYQTIQDQSLNLEDYQNIHQIRDYKDLNLNKKNNNYHLNIYC